MTPIQQMFLGLGEEVVKSYVDDAFSTTLWTGDGASSRTITNNIDTSTDGGLIWIKNRQNASYWNVLFDSVRGGGQISSNNNDANLAQASNVAGYVSNYSTTGFTLTSGNNSNDTGNKSGEDNVAWTFKKTPGFFDVVTYTGTGSSTQISHSLASVPGLIMVKKTSHSGAWVVYHRSLGNQKYINLNLNSQAGENPGVFGANPTTTDFTVGTDGEVNQSGHEYVAYVFAGGDSTTDKAVEFDGDDYLSMPVSNTDFDWGASDSLTIECFLNLDDVSSQAYNSIINRWTGSNYSFGLDVKNNGNLFFYFGSGTGSINTAESSGTTISTNTWYHVAVVKDGTTGRFFIDGKACGTFTWNLASSNSSQALHVGNLADGNVYDIDGELSNVRMTIGQALYTTNFNVPSDPLTTTSQGAVATNVKLLCCNQSTTTGSTVAPGTITANGNPTVTTSSSIFDDSAAHVFAGTNSIIRTGTYIGNGSSTGPVMNLGWEAQWILIKEISTGGQPWSVFDSMRGIVSGGGDNYIHPNENSSETTELERVDVTPTGFKITDGGWINNSGETYAWMAIRRPDGYVGKPADAGTDVFAMDTGAGSSTIPNFDSGFPVDFATAREFAGAAHWNTGGRLIQGVYVDTDNNNSENGASAMNFESNVGWNSLGGWNSAAQSWMWKRGAGFDMVSYKGYNPSGIRDIPHNLNAVPEMIWMKARNYGGGWSVYHKGCNGGTNPEQYHLRLDNTNTQTDSAQAWADTAPTSTHWTVADDNAGNGTYNYIAMLFASVTGISKVGYFAGSDYSNTISLGFAPRFLLLKNIDATEYWPVYDSLRGWNNRIAINNSNAQATTSGWVTPTASGVTLIGNQLPVNKAGNRYIYYAHA